jgi:hypothetical protein
MTPEQQAKYEKQMTDAAIIREFVAHPGMKLLTERLNKRNELKTGEWLNAKTPQEAEIIRQESRAYGVLMGTLNEFLLRGAQAQKNANTATKIY